MNLITHAIRKQTAIDALARLDADIDSVPPERFLAAGRRLGKTTHIGRMIWRIANERAYLESIINS